MILEASVILDSLLDVSSVLKYEYSGMILSVLDDFSLINLGWTSTPSVLSLFFISQHLTLRTK